MEFTFSTATAEHRLELSLNEDQSDVVALLDGSAVNWAKDSDDLQAPRFVKIDGSSELRVQYFRGKWYVTLDDKPLEKSATVATTKLKKLTSFIYTIAVFQLVLGAVFIILDPQPLTWGIFGIGLFILILAYETSKVVIGALYVLIGIIALDVILQCITMYEYYNIAPEHIRIPFFVPCMRVLLELFFLIVLVPGIFTLKQVKQEQALAA